MSKLIVKFSTVAKVRNIYTESTYTLEGIYLFRTTCWIVFDYLDSYINNDSSLSKDTIKVSNQAIDVIAVEISKVQVHLSS